MVSCKCSWTPDSLENNSVDSGEDLETKFGDFIDEIFDKPVFGVETQYSYIYDTTTSESTTTTSVTTDDTTTTVTSSTESTTFYTSTESTSTNTASTTEKTTTTTTYPTTSSDATTTTYPTTTTFSTPEMTTTTTTSYPTTTIATDPSTSTTTEQTSTTSTAEETSTSGTTSTTSMDLCDTDHGGCSHYCSDSTCSCPECWELGADMKTCEPEKDKVLLECNPNSMTIKVNKCVAPDAVDVTLNDATCKTSSSAGDFYELTTQLDSCDTALSQSSEGDLVFANEVYASPQQNSIIFTSAETRITFHCR